MMFKVKSWFMLVVVFGFSSVAAAETQTSPSVGLNIGFDSVNVRSRLSNHFSLLVGANYDFLKEGNLAEEKIYHKIGVNLGFRLYMNKRDVNTFIDLLLNYSVRLDNGDKTYYPYYYQPYDVYYYRGNIAYGIEKYIASNVSVEAAIGVSVDVVNSRREDSVSLAIPSTAVAINYFF